MCFTFLPACFGAINTSTRYIDLDGDYNTVMHSACCLRVACKVSTNHRVLRSYKPRVSVPSKLQGESKGRCPQPTKENPASGCGAINDQRADKTVRQSNRLGIREEIMVGRKADREIIARRNSWRDRMMIKFNFCFFCRGWWAFLLLQLHMLQALAQDDVPPYFKTEPGLPQIHLEGNRLVLTCLAEGSWPLEFKWLHNDTEITAYSTEYKYIIPALQRSHAGFYQCVVRNRMGALMQRKSEVQVAYMGNFMDTDQGKTVSQGQAAVLDFLHIISYPRPQVTWFRDGHKIIPSSRIAITLENQLVILAAEATDAGGYYVQAVNEKNGENKTSPFLYLSVANAINMSDTTAPVIVVPPRNTSVVAGNNEITLECVANARPIEKLSITWKRNGLKISSGVNSFGRRLTITNPTSADIGMYFCEAEMKDGTAEPARAKAFLSIMEPPYFTAEPETRILAEVEKTVDLLCQAMGVPVPTVTWYKDSVPLNKLQNPRYKVLMNGGLQIQGLHPDDSGIFQCFASNKAGEIQTYTYLDVTNIKPTFTRPPMDTTVTEGMSAVLTCEVTGAPKPAITWKRGNQILASGSVQIPRFILLESGGLQVIPVFPQDAGNYTCYAVNSEGALNAFAILTVWNRTFIVHPPEDSIVIKGTTATLQCEATHDPRISIRYVWKKDNVVINPSGSSRVTVQKDGTLLISQTWSGDIGDYTCEVISFGGNDSRKARIEVIELPHSPQNLLATLNSSYSRSVILSWVRPFDGNSPVLYYIVELSENNSPWKVHLSNVDPKNTSVTVSGLTPARTYQFRICAVNQVGKGQYSTETSRLLLPEEPPSAPPKNIVASGRTNQSIMVQWQPPPESEHNGVLHGYILRYRLAGLPGEYHYKNITSAEINYCLVKDLIIWTQYEIQVASYNGAGLGEFSRAVTEYTLQGVPTAPPQNVQAVAVNSTTIQFLWTPPPQQFINGINQGYKLLAWPVAEPESVTVVTIAPDFHGVHSGCITNLKKFTAYYTSVLCFTTPGDGPRSPPQLLCTHEDKPGAVGHLSFTEILDTSLKVSWQEPIEKNGIITGYQISWEVYNRNESRLARTLANTTLEYKITGLSSLTTYTIEVAAITAKGTGVVTSSTISSGVPPELPGAPSNLVISNISPRSATLQFRPGYDGKTSISKWIVEGQVGVLGDEEEWVSLYEVENEPDAQMLEIPNLIPYTYYRFRMRQANIVGQSPLSQPSRVIQTLQAPPDIAPGSLTVRTASETSLWIRWMPLPDAQYNGNPESVGYRIKLWRVDLQSPVLMKIINDRLEREYTIEDLEEWVEYELQIQAFNAIGAGPWSDVVRSCTRESVPSAPPENVSAEAVSSTQILLTWTSVPESEQNGLILGYKILFKAKDLDSEPKAQIVRGNHTQSVLLASLRKYVLYEIQVLAFTRIGDGVPNFPPVIERTKDDAPGPPVRLVFPEVRLTSVRIVWQPPEEPNGIILGYQIAYRLATSSPNTFTTVEVGSTVRQFMATDLSPESAYIFRTSAKTRQGWGEPLEATVITTEKRERPAPPRELRIPQSEVSSKSLQLHWIPGSDGSSPIRYFTVQLRELPNGEWQTYSSSVNHETTSCVIERLNPFTSYKLRLKATNDIGDSDFSAETEAVTTLQDVPGEPPRSVSVTPHTTSSVLVQWQPPKVESLNGLLLGYRIYYRELEYETGPGTESKTIKSPSALRTELTPQSSFQTVNSPSALTTYELTQLKKYKRYEVVITAYNIIGESPTSTPVEVFVGEAAPAMAPQNIQINALTASQLEITWDPPPIDSQNGNIQGYKIYYWDVDSQNDTEKVKVLFLPETTVRLKNLTSHTKYMVCISAFNAAGDGPRSSPRQGRTHQAAPSAPSFLAFSEITCTMLNVSWGEPTAANGILQGYRVVYEPLAPVQGVSKVVTVDIKGNWQRWLKVRDLTKGVTYLFRVQARTITYGPELQANITAGPAEGSPGSPQEILVTKSASGLTLHWTEGDSGNKPTTGYIIEARPSDEGLWDMFVKDIPRSATSYTVSLDKLKQGVSYEFRVVAVNELGYGEPSTPSAAVSAQMETPFYEEWWFLLVMALSSLILILLVVFALVLHGQSKKYKNCSTGKNISNVEESVTLDNGGFAALELNSRHLNVKNTFSKKNGTRSPPRPSPGGLRYSDEDICSKYNGAVLTESVALNEKPMEVSESEATDSDYEDELPKHSFVNHYMSDPTYYNSWKRQQKGVKPPTSYRYEECAASETEPYFQTVITTQSTGGVYTPTGQPAPSSRTPVTGFSSFV
nr:protein sidekick-1 isoform X1 [Pelodiscus sinensis]XP_006112958.1 protein sidekick-1 isoform X1 [Pelodiscus sinensis]XP_025034766.1 protein sidekick-1 isoform X1 [Pelodiscus sinensis]XP_025034772.1 protein sidekick-1 isoform X1 [Pelodiscus sinensis]XP_025034774.1 protein sidekick-1 isoform X1 [Pelodiscus sinensis]XP_025034776.1 protein sidekick-1 isoform X1 [Pelodiscus sinensis]|eukprot:XP_006112957.1 protein sidekick-1 isoform X1 [Pelodiscus sinensis]